MRPLQVDFLSRSGPARGLWILIGVLWLVTVALGIGAAYSHQQVSQLRAQSAELSSAGAMTTAPVEVKPPPVSYEASAREMLRELSSSWPGMLIALEGTKVAGVTIVAVEVAPLEQQLRLEVQFTSYDELLKYVGELNGGEPVPRWILLQAQTGRKLVAGLSMATILGRIQP
jgi:hypothetical protein